MGEVVVGPLARSILDRYRAPGWALIVRILEQVRGDATPVGPAASALVAEGTVLDERILARQTVGADGWVTIGVVARADANAFLDVNLSTGDARVVVPPADWSVEQPWSGVLVPAAEFLDLAPERLPIGMSALGRPVGQPQFAAVGRDRPVASRVVRVLPAATWEKELARLFAALDDSALIWRRTQELLATAAAIMDRANHPQAPRTFSVRSRHRPAADHPARPR